MPKQTYEVLVELSVSQPKKWAVPFLVAVTIVGLIVVYALSNHPQTPPSPPTPTAYIFYPPTTEPRQPSFQPQPGLEPNSPTGNQPVNPTPESSDQDPKWYPCSGMQPSFIRPGMIVKVASASDLPNRLRSSPKYSDSGDNYVGSAPVGTKMKILDGPYCDTQSSIIYWHVRVIDKDRVENFSGKSSILNSVYTAENDASGEEWLVPSEGD